MENLQTLTHGWTGIYSLIRSEENLFSIWSIKPFWKHRPFLGSWVKSSNFKGREKMHELSIKKLTLEEK